MRDDISELFPGAADQDGRHGSGQQIRSWGRFGCRKRVADSRRPVDRVVRHWTDG